MKDDIKNIKEEIEKHTKFYSLVIFGSYVIGKKTGKSDLDVVVFIEEDNKKQLIENSINKADLRTILTIHSQVITKEEFLLMLKENEENLGKQIARKHLPIYNSGIFYSILKVGIKNGFKL